MILDFNDLAARGLPTLFALFLVVLVLLRLGTRATTKPVRWVTFTAAWAILTCAPTFRVLGITLNATGGYGDADLYRQQFLSPSGALGEPMARTGTGGASEPLYLLLIRLLRQITDDPHVFFFILYGIIAYGFVYFVARTLRADSPILPLIIMFPAWLHAFSGIRNWIAISLLLVALVWYMRKKTWLYYIWVVIATGFHFSAALYFMLPITVWLLFRPKAITWNIVVLIAINILTLGLSGPLSRALAGTRYAEYLTLDPSNFTLVLQMTILTFVGLVLVRPSDRFSNEEKRLLAMPVFMASVITMILMYGGYRYVLYPVIPLAIVASWAVVALRHRYPTGHPLQLLWKVIIYATIFGWTAINLARVIRLTTVFPVIWSQ